MIKIGSLLNIKAFHEVVDDVCAEISSSSVYQAMSSSLLDFALHANQQSIHLYRSIHYPLTSSNFHPYLYQHSHQFYPFLLLLFVPEQEHRIQYPPQKQSCTRQHQFKPMHNHLLSCALLHLHLHLSQLSPLHLTLWVTILTHRLTSKLKLAFIAWLLLLTRLQLAPLSLNRD